MKIKYKSSSVSTFILWGVMIIPLGVLLLLVSEDIEFLPIMFLAGLFPSILLPYKRYSKENPEILQYMDFRRIIIFVIIGINAVYVPYYILKWQFNKILGFAFVIVGIVYVINEVLNSRKAREIEGEEKDYLILKPQGIKIPGYVEIPWNDIREVVQYKDNGIDSIGIIVDKAVQYKITSLPISKILMGSNRSLISMKEAALIFENKNNADKLVKEMKNRKC